VKPESNLPHGLCGRSDGAAAWIPAFAGMTDMGVGVGMAEAPTPDWAGRPIAAMPRAPVPIRIALPSIPPRPGFAILGRAFNLPRGNAAQAAGFTLTD
jgi:hypothetical protein